MRGGPYDQPGPNIPAQVAHLPIFGCAAQRAANAALRAAAQQHGVRFSDAMERRSLITPGYSGELNGGTC